MKRYTTEAQSYIDNTQSADLTATYNRVLPYFRGKVNLLDLGCGSGRDAFFFHQSGFNVTAVDLSEPMVKIVKNQMPFPVLVQDILHPTLTTTFDAIWACASLLHIPFKDQDQAFHNIHKLLNHKGILYCSYKLGNSERIVDDLLFTDMNLVVMQKLQFALNLFEIKSHWISPDTLKQANRPDWINFILIKK